MIRKMTAADHDDFLRMMDTFYHSDAVLHEIPRSTMERCFRDACDENTPYVDGYILDDNGRIAGFALVAIGYSTEAGGICVQIEDLYLDEAFRGRGLGRELFDYLQRTYAGEARRLRLEVERGNTEAQRLYKRLGFKELPYMQMVKDSD